MRTSAVSFGNYSKNDADKRKRHAEEAVVGTGAVAAAGRKAGFSMFNSSKKLGMVTQEAADAVNLVKKPVAQTRTLFGNFKNNAKTFSSKILGLFENFKKMKYVAPLIESRLFRCSAAFFGTGLAVLTLIAGFTNIAKASTMAVSDHVTSSRFLNSLTEPKEKTKK